jgi:hypothetical protein
MRDIVIQHLEDRFQSWLDLAEAVEGETLLEKLPAPKYKSLREHFWCVIGGRESYIKALSAGLWDGFGCSLETVDKPEVIDKMKETQASFKTVLQSVDDWTADRDELLATLLEHETMHEGQVIRLMYGLEKDLPSSWKWA